MGIKRLLNQTCEYEELIDSPDSEYGLKYRNYKSPETIRCFKYDNGASTGSKSYGIGSDGVITNNATKAYNVIDKRVKEGDRLDGRIVVAVDTHYNFRGNFHHKACSVV